MGKSKIKIALLFLTVYSFFIAFIFNVFGWALSYSQLTYEWKVLNIRQARRAVFDTALLHFGIFAFCCFCYIRKSGKKDRGGWFHDIRSNQTLQQSIQGSSRLEQGYNQVQQIET